MSRTVLVFISLLLAAAGGAGNGPRDDASVQVVAAFYPLAWAAERVGGEKVDVRNLTPPGAEPHDVELSARDVERIRAADVVLYLGAGFQPAVEEAVDGAKGTAVDLLAGEALLPGEAHEGEEDDLDRDPHVWLDPVRYAAAVERIGRALGRPDAAAELQAELRALDRELAHGLNRCRRRELVTTHAAFGYLARRYRLEQIPITGLTPEAEPTPRELEEVVEHVRRAGATTIFFETLVSPRLAETVARETGATTAVLNPIEGLAGAELDRGEDYLSIMRKNLAALRRALACR
jgi:zinc transport system substrate-binding protein